mmetsp:Transcript_4600/g.4322  ORF Transcript_4600/g.4322 Transcript_4600/m.4322 type:complete len:138 (-) Transcript_4600:42-455(-)
MIQLTKDHGEKKQIKFQGEPLEIFYYVHFLNEKYLWLFESQEQRNLTFKATFTFALENLAIEGYSEDPKSFKIELGPGQMVMRSLVRKNPQAESKYKCSYTFVIEGWLEYKESLLDDNHDDNHEDIAREDLAREDNV